MAIARRAVRLGATAPLKSGDPTVEELSRQLNDLKRSLPSFVIQGVSVDFHVMGPGSQTIKHGLGRTPSGVLLTYLNYPGAAGTWCNNGWDSTVIYIYASVEATGKLWVF